MFTLLVWAFCIYWKSWEWKPEFTYIFSLFTLFMYQKFINMRKILIFAIAAIGLLACTEKNDPKDPSNDSITITCNPTTKSVSVSATKKVRFSQGNLQYQASTQTWRFAENQYDMIGSDNSNISASYNGWIDLFGWGTGNNPTNSSSYSSDYASFNDWGNNIGEGWRTLSKDEWVYLFYGRSDAAHLFGMGSVNGVKGTILLPDNWAGAKFTDTENGLADQGTYYYNSNGTNFSFHTYTADQWSVMESAGAVFLPAAGYRYGTIVDYVGSFGGYWSSTPYVESYAYDMDFGSYGLSPQGNDGRVNGHSVRLLKDVE